MTLPSGGWVGRGQRHSAEMGFAVGRREFPTCAEVLAAILERVAGPAQVLNTVVERDQSRDFLPHFRSGFAREQARAFGINSGGDFAQDLPFRSRFANLSRNFRAKHDPALGARL